MEYDEFQTRCSRFVQNVSKSRDKKFERENFENKLEI